MLTALCNAAKDGVDVRIVTPGIPDKKMIFLLTQSTLHTAHTKRGKNLSVHAGIYSRKCFVCDDEIATVGSVNLDFRSLYLHFECGVFLLPLRGCGTGKEDCLNTFACSRADDGRVLQKPAGTGTASAECAARLLAPLL